MQLTIEATDVVTTLEGENGATMPARVWEGQTDTGIRVVCFVTRLAVPLEADQAAFEAELQETRPPESAIGRGLAAAAIPNRLVL